MKSVAYWTASSKRTWISSILLELSVVSFPMKSKCNAGGNCQEATWQRHC